MKNSGNLIKQKRNEAYLFAKLNLAFYCLVAVFFFFLGIYEWFNPTFYVFIPVSSASKSLASCILISILFAAAALIPFLILRAHYKREARIHVVYWIFLFSCFGFGTYCAILLMKYNYPEDYEIRKERYEHQTVLKDGTLLKTTSVK